MAVVLLPLMPPGMQHSTLDVARGKWAFLAVSDKDGEARRLLTQYHFPALRRSHGPRKALLALSCATLQKG